MSKFNQQQSNNNLTSTKHHPKARWDLLPQWIKFFSWVFLVYSVVAIIIGFQSFIQDGYFQSQIYGLETTQITNINELALIINILNLLVAYGYIFQKDWAIRVGITNAIFAILICIFVMLTTAFYSHDANLRFEIFVLAFYLLKLKAIKEKWANIKI